MFGSTHCTPMGRPQNVLKVHGATVLCLVHAFHHYGSIIKCIGDLWSHRAMFGSMHRTPMGRRQNAQSRPKFYGAKGAPLAP